MKIEVGKFYKTKTNSKIRVYALDGIGDYPVHGAINQGDGWESIEFTLEGRFHFESQDRFPGWFDIESEWAEEEDTEESSLFGVFNK